MIQWAAPVKTHYDRDLERRVLAFLAGRRVTIENLEIQAKDGVVLLQGEVSSLAQERLCRSVAGRVAGVTRLIDQLEVRGSAERPAWFSAAEPTALLA